MPEYHEQSFLLAWAREIGENHPFLDFHIHPFDVLSGDIEYQPRNSPDGLYTRGSASYSTPTLVFQAESSGISNGYQQVSSSERAMLLASRFTYIHTGPKVIADQLDLVGISRGVLLPVARQTGVAETMLDAMGRMFSADNRFLLGCPFPIGIPCDQLLGYFRWARDTWNVSVIKLHPNLINLDPTDKKGQRFLEATLVAASILNLPIVVHGGRTPGLESVEQREYGSLSHLEQVNWGISSAPVIIAHASCYGLVDEEIPSVLKRLNVLLEKYPNIMADTSYLGLSTLQKLFKSVDRNRLIFGSDALYIPTWKAWLGFLQALQLVSTCPDDDLIRIASINPIGCLALSSTC